mmetsp:Transcript_4081/g.9754  ORF Transcript_4081/g.9754 Transcript_4081/m.9754 type:complete len:235 (+) Transcript_4081:48-752(+)
MGPLHRVVLQRKNLARFPGSEPITHSLHIGSRVTDSLSDILSDLIAAGGVAREGYENGPALALADDEHRHEAERQHRHHTRNGDAGDGPAVKRLGGVLLLEDSRAGKEGASVVGAEQVIPARVVPVVAEGRFDGHLLDLPGVHGGLVEVRARRELAVVPGDGLALVEACLLHEESLENRSHSSDIGPQRSQCQWSPYASLITSLVATVASSQHAFLFHGQQAWLVSVSGPGTSL